MTWKRGTGGQGSRGFASNRIDAESERLERGEGYTHLDNGNGIKEKWMRTRIDLSLMGTVLRENSKLKLVWK